MRHLMLVGELARARVPFVLALNMMDLARRRGLSFDLGRWRAPSARRSCRSPRAAARGRGPARDARRRVSTARPARVPEIPRSGRRALEAWAERMRRRERRRLRRARQRQRHASRPARRDVHASDRGFRHLPCRHGALFWTIFALATVPMDLIEATFLHLGSFLEAHLPAGAVRELLVGGLIGGVSGTIVFLPQICLLFFLITLLEDTGYLARAAFVMDRLLYRFGLPGYAFVPLLSSHACAHSRHPLDAPHPRPPRPARDDPGRAVHELLGAAAGLRAADELSLSAQSVLRRARFQRLLPARRDGGAGERLSRAAHDPAGQVAPDGARAAELQVALAARRLRERLRAGAQLPGHRRHGDPALSFAMWWLSAYPHAEPPEAAVALANTAEELRAREPERADELLLEAERLAARAQQEASFAGRLGRFAEPVFAPLGYDWRLTIGVLTSFAAREVFVSTMAVLVGSGDDETGVLTRIHEATRADGRPMLTPATAVSLLVFFVLAMQCVSTLVMVRRETREWKWPLLQLAWMTGLAWSGAFVAYQGLRAFGVS
jgi:ferrous iron transport protein B